MIEIKELDEDFTIKIPKEAKHAEEQDSISNDYLFNDEDNDFDDETWSLEEGFKSFDNLIDVKDADITIKREEEIYEEIANIISSEVVFAKHKILNKVKNSSDKRATIITKVYFFDKDGKQIDDIALYYEGLASGEEAMSFGISTLESAAKYYEIVTFSYENTRDDNFVTLDVKIEEETSKGIKGIVTNNSKYTVKYPDPFACFYKDNKLTDIIENFTDVDSLEPGKSANFEFEFYDDYDYDEVKVYCYESVLGE